GRPGITSVSVLTRRIGRAASNAAPASRGSSTTAIGPSQTARTAETLPTAKKGGTRRARRCSQLFAITSGPMPAGSPSATASGLSAGSAIIDHRVAPQIAQIALRPPVHPLLLDLALDLGRVRRADLGRVVAAAHDEDADPLLRAERRRRL